MLVRAGEKALYGAWEREGEAEAVWYKGLEYKEKKDIKKNFRGICMLLEKCKY